jgi:hypothetical protein
MFGKFLLSLIWGAVALLTVACASSSVDAIPTAPNMGILKHDSPTRVIGDWSTKIDVPPFPYSRPLPPQEKSIIDGLYTRTIISDDAPIPCLRCAGYRLEGGEWTLYLSLGVFKVFHRATGFEAVGSFSVDGNHLAFFNDPYCEEDLKMVGDYTWRMENNSLILHVVNDPCSIGLRAKNLTTLLWTPKRDPCQPPNLEAAITDHWKKPPECK